MRAETSFFCAIIFGMTVAVGATSSKAGDDLTIPPDLRSPEAVTVPAAEPKHQKKSPAKKSETKPKPSAASEHSEPDTKAEKKSSKSDEGGLGFDMKWNAANNPNAGPGSLFDEVHKNVNGATAGSGAEVGVKYKF